MDYFTHISGENRGELYLFALSTCIWCRKTKRLLDELGVDYSYVDVDLLAGAAKEQALAVMGRWNPKVSYPTLVINDEKAVIGFDEETIRKELQP